MNSPAFFRSSWARYAVAVGAVALGLGLYLGLSAWVGSDLPTFITFYPAVMVAALIGGLRPGLFATALAALAVDYWIQAPRATFGVSSLHDGVALGLFGLMGAFISTVAHLYQRARPKAAAYDQVLALRETRREKEFLANLLEHASHPFAVGYPDGRLGRFNRAYEELTGYTAAELRALDWFTTLTPPEWRELEQQKLDELNRTGQPVRYEKEYVRKDGSRVPIELLVHLARDAAGKPEYYYAFLTDITERRRAEQAERASAAQQHQLNTELQAANASLVESRTAAINLMNDAVAARQQAEQASAELRASEDRLRFALETIHTGAWDLDLVDHTAFRSLEHDRVFGYANSLPKWTYERFLEHVLPEDRATVDGKFRHAMERQSDWNFECRIRRADGQVRWIWAAGRHHPDAAGAPRRMAGIVQDITERKQAEEKLRLLNAELEQRVAELRTANETLDASRQAALNLLEDVVQARNQAERAGAELARSSEQRRLALEAGGLGTWDYRFETGDVFWDERCRTMWGLPETKQIDYAAAIDAIHAEDRAGVDEAVKQALAGATDDAYHREFRVNWPDGTVHWVASHGRVSFEGEGAARRAVRFVGVNRDITQEKQAEEKLRRLNAELEQRVAGRTAELATAARYARSLIEASLDPLVTISPDGKITDVSRATELVTGMPRADLVGSDFSRYFTEPDKASAGYQQVLSQGVVRDYPLTIRHVSGRTTEVLYNATVYRNEAGAVQGVFAAARDMTELKKAEAELHATNKELEAFCYSVSHDLRGPLRGIDGFSLALLEDYADKLDAEGQRNLQWIRSECQKMGQLIDDLLKLSRLTRAALDRQPVDLTALAQQIAAALQQTAPERRAQFRIADGLRTTGDPQLLRIALSNLLDNAWKYSSNHDEAVIEFGSVRLEALRDAPAAARRAPAGRVFFVRDNGAGFDMAYADKLFAPFQRLHSVKEFPGTGIGLATVQRIIHRQGGQIWVEARPGQGATFYFTLAEQ